MQLPFDPVMPLLRMYSEDTVMKRNNTYAPGRLICNSQGLTGNNPRLLGVEFSERKVARSENTEVKISYDL